MPSSPPRTRARRRAASGLAAVVLAALVAGVVGIHSAPARAFLLRRILAGVNEAIDGRLEADELEIHGAAFSVRGLRLVAPSGETVATAERADGIPLWPLVRERLVLDGARLAGVHVELALGSDGVPLFRAFGRRQRAGGAGGSGLVLRAVEVDPARVVLAQRRWSRVAPEEVLEGAGSIRRGAEGEPITIELHGSRATPVAGPFRAEVRLGGDAAVAARDVAVDLGGLRVHLRLRSTGGATAVRVDELAAAPDAARALWRGWPAAARLAVHGDLVAVAGRVAVELEGALGDGALAATGAVTGGAIAPGATLAFRGLDLATLGLVRTTLDGRLSVGHGTRDRIEARIAIERGSAVAGRAVGPATATVEAGSRRIAVSGLDAVVEGARVRGRAVYDRRAGAFLVDGRARGARDLAARVAGRIEGRAILLRDARLRAGAERWTLARPARIALRDGGVSAHRVTLRSGRREVAVWGTASRARTDATAVVRGVNVPRLGAVTARLHVVGAARTSATLDARAGRMRLTARADSPAPLADVVGAARGDPARASASVRATLRTPDGAVTLDATWERGVARVDTRVVATAGGTGELVGTIRPSPGASPGATALDLRASVRGLDASALAALVPSAPRATGRIDATAQVSGLAADPRVAWELRWAAGHLESAGFGRYGPIRLESRGDEAHADAILEVESGGGTLAWSARAWRVPGGARFDTHAELRRFPIVVASQLRARATGRLAGGGSLRDGRLSANARVERSRVELPDLAGSPQGIPRPEGIVVVQPDGTVEGAPDPAARPVARAERQDRVDGDRRLELVVTTPEPVRVAGGGVDLQVTAAPELRVAWEGRLMLFGTLRAPAGHVEIAGTGFDLVSGTSLRFAGPPEAPFVELAATRDVRKREPVVYRHGRRGPIPRDEASTLPRELQLHARLSGGIRPGAPGSAPVAHSTVEGRGWGSVLVRALAAQVPLDAFLERGVPARTADVHTRPTGQVEVGTVTRLAGDPEQGENRRTLRVGKRIGAGLRVQGSSGDGGVGGIDVVWERGR